MRNVGLQRKNLVAAKRAWHDQLNPELVQSLRYISEHLDLSIVSGELVLLSRSWYVTHSGLLKIATRSGCRAIHVHPVFQFCNPDLSQWTFRATVYKSLECKGFTGYGDASPSNTSQSVRGAELRIAETRAVNRALRKAYGIGLCSIEEISSSSGPLEPVAQAKKQAEPAHVGANGNGHHLRDRLLVLIRQQKLDGVLVKSYASDFCGVKELRDASREQVQEFINHLSEYAANDRDGLLCQLNGYASKQESAA